MGQHGGLHGGQPGVPLPGSGCGWNNSSGMAPSSGVGWAQRAAAPPVLPVLLQAQHPAGARGLGAPRQNPPSSSHGCDHAGRASRACPTRGAEAGLGARQAAAPSPKTQPLRWAQHHDLCARGSRGGTGPGGSWHHSQLRRLLQPSPRPPGAPLPRDPPAPQPGGTPRSAPRAQHPAPAPAAAPPRPPPPLDGARSSALGGPGALRRVRGARSPGGGDGREHTPQGEYNQVFIY